jgi:type III secretory pathway component EscR
MRIISPHFLNAVLLGAALIAPIAMAPIALQAQEHKTARTYHDKQNNDDHEWNNHEDQAYRMWAKEKHRGHSDFSKLKENDQQDYWGWRHQHSDAELKIKIR